MLYPKCQQVYVFPYKAFLRSNPDSFLGLLAKRFGAKYVVSLATAIGGIMCFFHPMAAEGGWVNVCVLRVLTGLVQGSVYPCFHTLLSKWVPCTERGFLTTGVYSGAQFGTAVILVSSGSIFESSMGWPGLFYVSGGLGLAWALLFFWQGANEPATSSSISKAEREYIEHLTGSNTGSQVCGQSFPMRNIWVQS